MVPGTTRQGQALPELVEGRGKDGFFGIFVEFGLTLLLFGGTIKLYVLEE
jgi:hypothetical protein